MRNLGVHMAHNQILFELYAPWYIKILIWTMSFEIVSIIMISIMEASPA